MSDGSAATPWFAIGAVVVVAAFLAWYLWATSKRRRRRRSAGSPAGDPRDAWDALSHGEDPTLGDPLDPGEARGPEGSPDADEPPLDSKP